MISLNNPTPNQKELVLEVISQKETGKQQTSNEETMSPKTFRRKKSSLEYFKLQQLRGSEGRLQYLRAHAITNIPCTPVRRSNPFPAAEKSFHYISSTTGRLLLPLTA